MQGDLDLPAPARRTLEEILARHIPGRTVWAFGSRIDGRARPTSDLDLVVKGDRIDLDTMAALRAELEDAPIGIRIDVSEWEALPEGLRRQVETRHAVVQVGGRSATRSS